MVDVFKGFTDMPDFPYRNFYAVTPHDTNALPFVPKAIVSLAGGTVTMVGENGATAVQVTLIANTIYRYSPQIIKATGTAATGIIALH